MNRRDFFSKAGLVTGALVGSLSFNGCLTQVAKESEAGQRPNFIFIMTDDQKYDAVGFSEAYPFLETPYTDRLREDGIDFKNCFVTTALCSPSRACFLTGAYAHKNGVMINETCDPKESMPMLQEVLQESGYETAMIGKWHMAKTAQPRRGFDYWLSFEGQGVYDDPVLNENGNEIKVVGYITDILTDYAVRFIKKKRSRPFCLFLWHKAVHSPFTPADCDKELYVDERLPEPENYKDNYSDKPQWVRRGAVYGLHKDKWAASEGELVPDKVVPDNWDPKNKRKLDYLRAISAVDKSIGKIDNTLKQEGLFDDTFMMFTSDNGYLLGEHHSVIDKRVMWEESIRVPLLVRYPRIGKASKIVDEMILNLDFMPTALEIAGVKIPSTVQGQSFVPFLSGRDAAWRDSFFYEYFQEDYAPGIPTITGVRTGRYKYIETPCVDGDIFELYDLELDPLEMNNLVSDSDKSLILKSLQGELSKLKKLYCYDVECL